MKDAQGKHILEVDENEIIDCLSIDEDFELVKVNARLLIKLCVDARYQAVNAWCWLNCYE